jgi:hypothetical protein
MPFDPKIGAKVIPFAKPNPVPGSQPHEPASAPFKGVEIEGALPASHPFAKDVQWQHCLELARDLYRWCESFEKKRGRQPSVAEMCGVERKASLNALVEQHGGGK